VTGSIPGHGYREAAVVTPRCKCGWSGRAIAGQGVDPFDAARAAYEKHKAAVRHETGYETPGDRRAREQESVARRRRELRLVR
jgi:hypothetical protein